MQQKPHAAIATCSNNRMQEYSGTKLTMVLRHKMNLRDDVPFNKRLNHASMFYITHF